MDRPRTPARRLVANHRFNLDPCSLPFCWLADVVSNQSAIIIAKYQFVHAQSLYEQAKKVRDEAKERLKSLISKQNKKP